ncbi:hypothetical protein [Mesorhizobium sp. M1E.F.Ca.ET.063.01.1.1]|nr:hypothetical protein [Mesorhizobium sp. M1E.F.Ca.ET.063.01.1.1]
MFLLGEIVKRSRRGEAGLHGQNGWAMLSFWGVVFAVPIPWKHRYVH